MHRLVSARCAHRDERQPAEHCLDHGPGDGLEEVDVAAGAVVDDAQIADIVTDRTAGKRDQEGLIQQPAGGLAEYRAVTASLGNLVGICPSCDTMIYRRVSLEKLPLAQGELDVCIARPP